MEIRAVGKAQWPERPVHVECLAMELVQTAGV